MEMILECSDKKIKKEDGKIWSSIEIRKKVKDMKKIRGWSVVEGLVRVVLIERENE
jgi:hypothetical protein